MEEKRLKQTCWKHGKENIQGCDQHKEVISSYICLLPCFIQHMMDPVITKTATIEENRYVFNYLFKIYLLYLIENLHS
jgi:hypothetical protein